MYLMSHTESMAGIAELAGRLDMPGDYFDGDMKIQQACKHLGSSSLHVSEIAVRCGFESLFSFSRAFKAITGMSPRQYLNFASRTRRLRGGLGDGGGEGRIPATV